MKHFTDALFEGLIQESASFEELNINSPEELLNTWKKKAEFSDYYKNAITTWTIRDVNKCKSAISNNIRYKVYYNEEDLYD